MKREKNEFLGLLCNLYLIVLLVALPLYTGEGYWMLGDTKYILFRNVSYLCLGCWLVLGIPGRVRAVREGLGCLSKRKQISITDSGQKRKHKENAAQKESVIRKENAALEESVIRKETAAQRKGVVHRKKVGFMQCLCPGVSIVDCAVAAYGVCVAVSALCSSYGQLAWTGYNEWYMGAISQFMFVGIYFFVSRQYDGSKYPIYLGEAAFFLVTLLGLLHRFGIDPLGLKIGWNSGDWEYNHMLSTLGNINWLCGFYSVALAWLLTFFMGERKRWRAVLWYLAAVAAFVLLGIQGSQGGLLILGVGAVVCIWLGWGQGAIIRKLALLLAGFLVCMPLIDWLTKLRGKKAAVAVDGNVFEHTVWYGWVMAAVVCMCVYFLSRTGILRKFGACVKAGLRQWKSQWKEWKTGRGKENKETEEKNRTIRMLIFLIVIGVSAAGIYYLLFGTGGGSLSSVDSGSGVVLSDVDNGSGIVVPDVDSGSGIVLSDVDNGSGIVVPDVDSGSGVVLPDVDNGSGIVLPDVDNGSSGALSGADDGGGIGGLFGIDDSFGSGRGFLWRIALEGFSQAGWKDKLLGAGPDCYGEAVFNRLGAGTDVWNGEHWEGAIFTNAHNEILTQLINVGILGMISYLAIFLTGLWRYCGRGRQSEQFRYEKWLGVLAITMYGAHSLISFQQVLNAPLLFLTLGLCEYGMRRDLCKESLIGQEAVLERV